MTERIISILAFLTLAAFLGILFLWVPRVDLGLVLGATLALAGYDFLIRKR